MTPPAFQPLSRQSDTDWPQELEKPTKRPVTFAKASESHTFPGQGRARVGLSPTAGLRKAASMPTCVWRDAAVYVLGSDCLQPAPEMGRRCCNCKLTSKWEQPYEGVPPPRGVIMVRRGAARVGPALLAAGLLKSDHTWRGVRGAGYVSRHDQLERLQQDWYPPEF